MIDRIATWKTHEFRNYKLQFVMKKLFKQYETTDLNLNVFFKYIKPPYLSFANAVNVSLLFSVVSDSSYFLTVSDGSIPLALFPFFNMFNEVALQKTGQH